MPTRFLLPLLIAMSLGLAIPPASAEAQGRGKQSRAQGSDQYGAYNATNRGPPFCQNGQGHPVHGRNWCVQKGFGLGVSARRYDDRYDDDRYYDDRQGSSYERDHAEFHRYLDRKYNDLAARRPLDITYQAQLRLQKQSEHNDWHRRMGISH